MPMGYIVPILKIAVLTDMVDEEIVSGRLLNLVVLEEDQFVVGLHQRVHER